MHENPLTPDEKAVEAALSALVPTAPGLARDELLYAAGVREARRRNRRRLPLWLGAAVALSGLSGLVGAVMNTAAARPQDAVVDAGADTRPADTAAAQNHPAAAPQVRNGKSAPRVDHSFSPILNVSHWDVEQLRKAGVSVVPCSQWCDMFDPPMEFVTIRYDCTQLPADHEVLMFVQFISTKREAGPGTSNTDVTMRSVRGVPDQDSVSLEFAVSNDEYLERTSVWIMIWPPATEEGRSARGYRLSLKRILELSRLKAVGSGF